MSVIVKVDDSRLQDWLNGEGAREGEAFRFFQEEGSLLTIETMRSIVPLRSGFLRESVTRTLIPTGFTVYPTAKYAEVVDQGSGPHTIFPSTAKVLRFVSASGETVFARHVKHPGFPGRFFVQRTVDVVRERLGALVSGILERVYGG